MGDFEYDDAGRQAILPKYGIDFPAWVVESLDREAARIGAMRQSILKIWLVERLKAGAANR